MPRIRLIVAGMLAFPLSQAQAAINWDFTPPTGTSPIYADYNGTRATVSAFATGSTSSTTTNFQTASANSYGGGIGITNLTTAYDDSVAPNHAVDNNRGFEFALFSFSNIATGQAASVTLNSLGIGYKDTDADVSILAYTGTGTPTSLTSRSISSLLTNGWSLIGNYANLSTGDSNARTVNASSISSSYWLIGGYYGATNTSAGLDSGNDYFKISGLGGVAPPPTSGAVPEPSALILMTLAFFAWKRFQDQSPA